METEAAAFYTSPTFWVAVAFAIFVAFIVWRRVPAMVAKALDGRAEKIKRELDDAKKLRDEAERLLAEYKKKHAEAANEADAILKQAAEEAKLFAREAEKRLAAALERLSKATGEKIAQAEANAVKEVRAAAVESAVKAAEAVLGERLKAGRNQGLLDEAIEDLDQRLS